MKRKDADNAAAGRPHGHRRAFGFEPDGMTLVAAEASAICDARDRVLRGVTMTSICDDWNLRGIRPTTAPLWRVHGFKRMICGTRIAGLRKYQGEVVGTAAWPAIITPKEHDRIVAKLGDPWTRRRPGRPATYLLSGLLRCGRCGKTLRRGVRNAGRGKWACAAVPGDTERCGQISVTAASVDELVEEALLTRLDSGAVGRALRKKPSRNPTNDDASAVIVDLEQRIVQLGTDHDNGIISRREWLARRGPLTERLDAARARPPRPERDDAEALARLGGDVRKRWAALALEQRRAIARAVIDAIVINPLVRKGNTLDPDRVDVVWRGPSRRYRRPAGRPAGRQGRS